MGDEPPPPAIDADNSPFPLTDIDRLVLSQTDEEFKRHDWDELKEIIGMFRHIHAWNNSIIFQYFNIFKAEMIISCVWMFLGVLVYSYTIGSISKVMSD